MKFTMQNIDGSTREVEGRKFSHYIGNIRFWFFYAWDTAGQLEVSEMESGYRVGRVPFDCRAASLGDDKGASKRFLDALIAKHGPDRIKVVINSAPKIKKGN